MLMPNPPGGDSDGLLGGVDGGGPINAVVGQSSALSDLLGSVIGKGAGGTITQDMVDQAKQMKHMVDGAIVDEPNG
jgi:hypothetical protein